MCVGGVGIGRTEWTGRRNGCWLTDVESIANVLAPQWWPALA